MRRLIVLFVAVLLLSTGVSWSAISIGTSCTGQAGGVDNLSFSCLASAPDPFVLAAVNWNNNSETLATITYAGAGMTLAGTDGFTPPDYQLSHYYKTAPTTGTQTFAVTFSGLVDMKVGVTPFTGVHQVSAVGTTVFNHSAGTTSRSVDVTSAAGEVVIDALWACDSTGRGVGGGQTQQFTIGGGGDHDLSGSTEVGAALVTMSWTWTNADCGMIIATPIKPAAAAAVKRKAGILWLD